MAPIRPAHYTEMGKLRLALPKNYAISIYMPKNIYTMPKGRPMIATSTESQFKQSWGEKSIESLYTHWARNEPGNQIQLAYRNHWTLFQQLLNDTTGFNQGKRVLEVGCGRGSLSAYFADAGYDCRLLDI